VTDSKLVSLNLFQKLLVHLELKWIQLLWLLPLFDLLQQQLLLSESLPEQFLTLLLLLS
jgi:hypothetical protein